MKTFVITTKNPKEEYQKIKRNWFDPSLASTSETNDVESTIDIDSSYDQSFFNRIERRQDGEYQFILPEVVDPLLPSRKKSEYILDLLCVIAETYEIDKNDLFFIAHSRDLFPLDDARSGYGIVFNKALDCSSHIRQRVCQCIADGHIFQFHHTTNEVANLLLRKSPEDNSRISALGEALNGIVQRQINAIWGINSV